MLGRTLGGFWGSKGNCGGRGLEMREAWDVGVWSGGA